MNSGFQSFPSLVQKTLNYIWTFHGISHLFPIEEKIHLVNSDKSIAPVASTGGVADGVVAGGEAGEHSFGERELFWQKFDDVNLTKITILLEGQK